MKIETDPPFKRPLRILQIFNRYLKPGGEENSVVRIAEDLECAGHKVVSFWRASSEWTGPGGPPKWKQFFLGFRNPAVLKELRELHRTEEADLWIVHNVVPVVSLGVYRLAQELDVPIIQWLHNYRPISPGGALFAGPKALHPGDRWLPLKEVLAGSWIGVLPTAWLVACYALMRARGDFKSVKAWITVSEQMRKIFIQGGWPEDRLFAIRHSWKIQPPLEAAEDGGYFLFLGRMVETKGVRFLLDLWARPGLEKILLVMAGQGPLADELRHTTPPNVRWVGHVEGETKRELLAGCRAVLFPSIWDEPLGLVAYEAYQEQRPVLASALGGMLELVHDSETGRLLPPSDFNAWREAILNLDPQTSGQWGKAGRRWLEQNVSSEHWNRAFARIACEVLGAGSSREDVM
jgi:glycosyltransferase involved in cell wall biosynthesis